MFKFVVVLVVQNVQSVEIPYTKTEIQQILSSCKEKT